MWLLPLEATDQNHLCSRYFVIVQIPVINVEKFSIAITELQKTEFVTQPTTANGNTWNGHGHHHQKQISTVTSGHVNSCILLVWFLSSLYKGLLPSCVFFTDFTCYF